MVNGGGTDHSSDEGSTSESDATLLALRRKADHVPESGVRRTKDVATLRNTCDAEACRPTSSVDISSGTKVVSLPDITQESEEIPVRGYLTLKMLGSDVVYCPTVSQGSSQHHLAQKQDFNERPQPTAHGPFAKSSARGEMYYFVGCEQSWLPKSEMGGAKKLLDAYHAKLRCSQGKSEDGQESRAQKRSQLVVVEPDARDGSEPKKRRGRPQKMR